MENMNIFTSEKSMLKIGYGRPDDCIYAVDLEFEEQFEYSWLKNAINIKILNEIDNAIVTPIGIQDKDNEDILFTIFEISTGAKALMLCNMNKSIKIWGTIFGDNCNSILLELAQTHDITIYLQHLAKFPSDKFQAYSLLKQRPYKDYAEYEMEARWELVP